MNVSTAAPKAEFTEGVYIDYKYFNQQGSKPVYRKLTSASPLTLLNLLS